jgi:TrmH family RNA methyltransferase
MTRTEILTSPGNPLLKEVRRAIARGDLTHDGCCVAEGFHLLEEALRSDREVRAVLAAASVRSAVERHVRGLGGLRVVVVEDALFQTVSATETTQGVLALVRPPHWNLDQLFRDPALVVVLDGLQDPGNAGAIVRAAEAFGATGLMFLKGTVSPYSPKTVRASAGSLFRMPLVSGLDEALARAALEQRRLEIYAAMPAGKRDLRDVSLTRPSALIIGSEGRGVSERLRSAAIDLRIPVSGVESLNAAMAAGILLYEARRQRAAGSAVM